MKKSEYVIAKGMEEGIKINQPMSQAVCCGMCLEVAPKHHEVIGGDFSEMAGSRMCHAGIDRWFNSKIKGTRIIGEFNLP